MNEQDKEWIKGKTINNEHAEDIIKWIEIKYDDEEEREL